MSTYIPVLEIDAPLSITTWINSEPGIWVKNITPGKGLFVDPTGLACYFGDRSNQRKKIESLRVDGMEYSEQTSLADLRGQTSAFYWDETNQLLYMQFANADPPAHFTTIRAGASLGWSYGKDSTNDNTYSDIFYTPRIKSIPTFSKDRDALFFGILSYGGGRVELSNEDGGLDDFGELDLFGQPARIYLTTAGGALTEDEQIYEGVVGTVTNDFSTLSIQLRDKRDSFARSIPTDVISNYDDDYDGQVVPLAWGSIRGARAYRTAASTWVFADTTYNSVSASGFQVYYDNGAVASAGTVTDGTFTYSLGAGETEDKVTVDFNVTGFSTGLDILEDIFANYLNIAFNISNYNQTEWNNAKASAKASAVYLGEATSITKVIEQIAVDNQGILDIQDDGRITFRTYDASSRSVKELQNYQGGEGNTELLGGYNVTYDVKEFLTSAQVKYNQNRSTGYYQVVLDDSQQATIFARYNEYRNKPFETGLTSSSDATALASDIMDRSGEIVRHIEFSTYLQNYDLRVMDFVVCNVIRRNGSGPGLGVYEVLGYTRHITDGTIDIRAREVVGGDTTDVRELRITEGYDKRITESGIDRGTE